MEWTLRQGVFGKLCMRWPVAFDVFVSSLDLRYVYFMLVSNPMAAGMVVMLELWDFLRASAFPPFHHGS